MQAKLLKAYKHFLKSLWCCFASVKLKLYLDKYIWSYRSFEKKKHFLITFSFRYTCVCEILDHPRHTANDKKARNYYTQNNHKNTAAKVQDQHKQIAPETLNSNKLDYSSLKSYASEFITDKQMTVSQVSHLPTTTIPAKCKISYPYTLKTNLSHEGEGVKHWTALSSSLAQAGEKWDVCMWHVWHSLHSELSVLPTESESFNIKQCQLNGCWKMSMYETENRK